MSQTATPNDDRHQISVALSVITNPAHFYEQPEVLREAWQILKAARGEAVDMQRVGPAAYRVETEGPPISRAQAMSRHCLERLRQHAASKGIPIVSTVWPNSGDVA